MKCLRQAIWTVNLTYTNIRTSFFRTSYRELKVSDAKIDRDSCKSTFIRIISFIFFLNEHLECHISFWNTFSCHYSRSSKCVTWPYCTALLFSVTNINKKYYEIYPANQCLIWKINSKRVVFFMIGFTKAAQFIIYTPTAYNT